MIRKSTNRRPSDRGQRPAILGASVAALLALCLVPRTVHAQTWTGTTSGDWNTTTNWNPATVPSGAGAAATFGFSSTTAVSLSATTLVGSITFTTNATSPYTITTGPMASFLITSAGITNNSGITENFITASDGSSGLISFSAEATAGSLTQFTNQGSTVNGSDGGETRFTVDSTAGSATIINQGGTLSGAGGGITYFYDDSTAGSATIITNGGTGNGGGGATYFQGFASGGTARAITNGNGVFDISQLTGAGMNIGSIEGSGLYILGSNTLTVGGNNLSTTVSGVIADGTTGTGGSLVKTGTGTLALIGTNTYTGSTTVNGGALLVDGSLANTTAVTVNLGGTLGGTGTIAAPVTINSGGTLTHAASGVGTITMGSLTLNSGSFLDYELGAPGVTGGGVNDLTVVNGDLTLGGTLNINQFSGFGVGTYVLFTYTGALDGGALNFGALPTGFSAVDFTLQTSIANQVDLVVNATPPLLYWNGPVTAANNSVNGGTGTWDNAITNWTDAAGAASATWAQYVAVFSTGSGTVTLGDNIAANELRFVTGSGAYTVSVPSGETLTVSGAGVTNTSGVIQNFVTNVSGSSFGEITFSNNATAGSLTQYTNDGGTLNATHGGQLVFNDSSTAGGAAITNNGAIAAGADGGYTIFNAFTSAGGAIISNRGGTVRSAGGGATFFNGNSTAGTAAITNQGAAISGSNAAVTYFNNASTAGNATITNNGGAISTAQGGSIQFSDTAAAGSATITNQSGTVSHGFGGITEFFDSSTAGSATITNQGGIVGSAFGGITEFFNSSTAGSATIITNGGTGGGGGSVTYFYDSADGGTARAITNGNGTFDISNLANGGMNIGSIEGSGSYLLGGNVLTTGGNNLSTTVAGVIADGTNGTGGSLVKTGTGALTLTNTNTYTGSTTVNGGALVVNGTLASTTAVTVNLGGTLGGTGTIAAPVTINTGGTLTHGNAGSVGTITIGALTLNGGAIVDYQLGTPDVAGSSDLTVVNGNLTLGSGALNITPLAGFGPGTYDLFNYTGTLTGSTLSMDSLPAGFTLADFTFQITPTEVELIVTGGGPTLLYWDGATTTGDGAIHGGAGTWDNVTTNWTDPTGSNNAPWSPSTVAVFNAGSGSVTLGDNITAAELRFMTGAGPYTISVPTGFSLNITGAGLANTSGFVQSFETTVDGTGGAGCITFSGSATAGSMTQFTNDGATVAGGVGGMLAFKDTSTAGSATIINLGGTVLGAGGGYIGFSDTSSAGSATITNQGGTAGGAFGAELQFFDTSTAASATITDQGGTVNGGKAGSIFFQNNSSAGSAAITNNGGTVSGAAGGSTTFQDNSTAASATITNQASTVSGAAAGSVTFQNTSTAGSATITNNSGTASGAAAGSVTFQDTSTAGSATITNNSGAVSGSTLFQNSATGGSATINNAGGTAGGVAAGSTTFQYTTTAGSAAILNLGGVVDGAFGGKTLFSDTSTAGSATITNQGGAVNGSNGGGATDFFDNTTAGSATITNQGGALNGVAGGFASFQANATAGSSAIANQGGTVSGASGGFTTFANSATAGSATITNGGGQVAGASGGSTSFATTATAGSATITTNGGTGGATGGVTYFDDSADGGTARAITNGNGVFDISGLTDGGMKIGSIEGSGTYDLGGNTLTVGGNNLSTTVSGVIADGGFSGGTGGSLVKTGIGTLTLTGTSTYTGTTTISGGSLQVGNAGSAGSVGSVVVSVNAGATLSLVNVVGNTFPNSVSNGIGGVGTLLINSASDNSLSGTLTDGAAGQLALTLSGAGLTILTNSGNTYSGRTAVSNGTLQVGDAGDAGSIGGGALSVTSGGALSVVNVSGNTLANNISNGTGGVGALNINSANTNTLSGLLTDGGAGQLALTQSGSGTTILTNSGNAYSGATTISGGVLQIGTAGTAGSIGATSTVEFTGSGTDGVLLLVNVNGNAFANNVTTSVSAFPATVTLTVDSANTNTLSGTLTDDPADSRQLGLMQSGTGTTILTNAGNTYSGPTTVSNGFLQIGTAGSAGSIGVSGGVTVGSGGTLALVNVSGNTFADSVGNGLGGIGALIINSANTNNVSGLLADGGAGQLSVTQSGPGTTILTNNNTYTGATNVTVGTLVVNGSLAAGSTVTVSNSATLAGTGTIAGTVNLLSGSNLNPGGGLAPGTLTVGNLVLNAGSNSTFRLAQPGVNGSGVNDLVNVTNNLTIAGNLNVTPLGGFGFGSYTLFTYGGALTNNGFSAINGLTGFTASISTGVPHQVNLVVSLGAAQFWDGAGAANNGVISGGSGAWNATANNWTNASGATNTTWQNGTAVFFSPGGMVTLTSALSTQGLIFASPGYVLTGSGPLTLSGAMPAISVSNAGTSATLSVKIAGTAGLNANGAGTLILANPSNSYTGGTTISNGIVQLGNSTTAGALGAGKIQVGNGGTLTVASVSGSTFSANVSNGLGGVGTLNANSANTNTLSGTLTDGAAGQLALAQSDSKSTILTNAGNTYSGATTVSSGLLQIGTAAAAGSIGAGSAISVGTGGTLTLINVHGNLLANSVTNGLGGAGLVNVASTASNTLSGALSDGLGTLALTQSGTGTTILSGDDTYSGATTVNAGTLQIGNGASGNLSNSIVTVSGTGVLSTNLAGGSTMTANIVLNTTTSALKAIPSGASTVNTLSGVISGQGVFNQNGTGTTILNNTETYTGLTNVNAGTLEVDGSLAAASTVNVATAGTLSGVGTVNGKVALTGNGTIDFGPGGTIVGTLAVTGGNWTGLGAVNGLVTSSSGVFTITNDLTAAAGLAVTGGTISGLGTFTGNLDYASSANSTFGGTITDGATASTVTVNKASTTLTLTGSSYYTGGTTLANGSLYADSESALGEGTLTITSTGGPVTLGSHVNNTALFNPISVQGNVSIATAAGFATNLYLAGDIDLAGGTRTITGLSNTEQVQFVGAIGNGGVTFKTVFPNVGDYVAFVYAGAANTYTGPTTINNGAILVFAGETPGGGIQGNVDLEGDGVIDYLEGASQQLLPTAIVTDNSSGNYVGYTYFGGLDLYSSSGDSVAVLSGHGTVTLAEANLSIGAGNFSGVISDGDHISQITGLPLIGGQLTKISAGTLILSGRNLYTGATTISAGTLEAGAAATIPSSSAVIVDAGATFDLNSFNQSVGSIADGLGSGTISLGAAALTTGIDNSNTTFSGVIQDGGVSKRAGGSLIKVGLGTLTLDGADTYTGATAITAGTLEVDGSLAAGSMVNVGTSGTLTGVGTIHGNATLTGNGTIDFGSGGAIAGTLAVTGGNWAGAGTVGGAVTASSGIFTIGSGANLTASSGLAVTGGALAGTGKLTGNLNYTSTSSSTFGGVIADGTAASTLTVNKAATILTLTGANTFTGATTVSAGTLQLGDGVTAGTSLAGPVTVSGTGVLAINLADASTFSKNVSLAATGATLKTIQAGANTLSGVISGAGGLNQNGTGTTIVTGAEIYTGTTSVTTGTLQVDGSLAAASTVNVAAAGTLSGTGTVAGTVNLLAGGNLDAGDSSGPGTLTVGKLVLNTGSNANFRLAAPGTVGGGVNDLVNVTGNLTIAGNLNVTALPGFGTLGSYTLFTYGGTLTNTGFSAINGIGGYAAAVSTGVAHQVNLIVSGTAVTQYWDGTGAINNNLISGGSGTWNNTTNNWTNSTGGTDAGWQGGTAVFNAPGGTVTLGAPINVQGLLFGSTGYTLGGTSTLNLVGTATMAPTISVTNAGTTATISAPIIGKAGLTSSGAGTLILTSMTNSYTGGTNITNGFLQIGMTAAAGSIGGGAISIAGGGALNLVNLVGNALVNNVINGVGGTGTLNISATTNNTLSGALTDGTTGQLALTQNGTGTTILTNAGNAFSGATTISKGTLQIGTTTAAGSLGSSAVSVGSAATLSVINVAGNALANNISDGLGGTGLVSINSTTNLTLSGALTNGAGTLALTKAGTGTTTLSGSDTYTGATTVSAGTLQIGNGAAGNLTGTSAVTLSGTAILATDLADGDTFSNAVTDNSHVIATGTSNNYTVSSLISGTGNLTKTGANIVTVTNANTYKGGTAVSAGTLLVNNSTGSGTGSGAVTVNNTSTLGGSGTISGAATLNSGGTLFPSAGTPGTAGTTLHGSSLIWNAGGTLTLQLSDGADDALALSGALTKGITGTYTLDLINAGLISTNTYNLTLVTFASSTFTAANFNVELPVNYTGTLVKTSTSLEIENLTDPPPSTGDLPEGEDLPVVGTVDNGPGTPDNLTVTPTPEPGSVLLLAFGGGTLLGWRRRRPV